MMYGLAKIIKINKDNITELVDTIRIKSENDFFLESI